MWRWRRRASPAWLREHEDSLRDVARGRLVVVEKPKQSEVTVEVTSRRARDLSSLVRQFRGRVERLQSWVDEEQNHSLLLIGSRLMIARSSASSVAPRRSAASDKLRLRRKTRQRRSCPVLVIPAGAAFGTGDHPTTAMSLRLLETISLKARPGWSLLDLGTGSGIFALAGHIFGAKNIVALDSDPLALSTAKQNAKANRIDGVKFRLIDAHAFQSRTAFDMICANLYSGLLIQLLPKMASLLSPEGWAVLSGILRAQERRVTAALARSGLRAGAARRRGKWVALTVCRHHAGSEPPKRSSLLRRSGPRS